MMRSLIQAAGILAVVGAIAGLAGPWWALGFLGLALMVAPETAKTERKGADDE